MFKTFEELIEFNKHSGKKKRLVVTPAQAAHALEAAIKAYDEDIVDIVFVGDKVQIEKCLEEMRETRKFDIEDVADPVMSVQRAIEMINAGEGDIILKGRIETGDLLKVMFKKENNMRVSDVANSLLFTEIETYHKLLAMTDGAINTYPDVEKRRRIIQNSVDVMNKMGWNNPRVAVIAPVEKVNPKMPETVDAKALKEMNERGEISGCIVEGPISFDLAIDSDSARQKGFVSEVAGEADLMVYPNIVAGNIGTKAIMCTGHNKAGSFVVGLKVPIIVSSRGAEMEIKLRGIQLAATV